MRATANSVLTALAEYAGTVHERDALIAFVKYAWARIAPEQQAEALKRMKATGIHAASALEDIESPE